MAYIGNQVSSVPFIIDTFSGTGSATVFGQLTRAPAGVASIAMFISGVYKTPGVDYTLSGDMITFITAPASGTNNIVVHHMGNGSATQVPSDASVTGGKLTANSVRGNNIVAGTITGNLMGTGSISGNLIGIAAISGNQIGLGAISGNQIGLQAISGNQIGTGAISGNQIGVYAVSGNQIGTGAISANNFAGGGITSNVLSSNLSISTTRVAETVNVVTSAIGGNYQIHIANSTVYHFLANTTGNITFQMIANTSQSLNSLLNIGQTASVAIMLKQGFTRYRANVHIDGVLQTAYWAGNTQPQYTSTASQSMSYDSYTFSIIKIGDARYTVFASNTNFGQANGQGMSTVNNGFGPEQ
jgi:hypothetical protein